MIKRSYQVVEMHKSVVNDRSSNFENRPNLCIGHPNASVRPKHWPILSLVNIFQQIAIHTPIMFYVSFNAKSKSTTFQINFQQTSMKLSEVLFNFNQKFCYQFSKNQFSKGKFFQNCPESSAWGLQPKLNFSEPKPKPKLRSYTSYLTI